MIKSADDYGDEMRMKLEDKNPPRRFSLWERIQLRFHRIGPWIESMGVRLHDWVTNSQSEPIPDISMGNNLILPVPGYPLGLGIARRDSETIRFQNRSGESRELTIRRNPRSSSALIPVSAERSSESRLPGRLGRKTSTDPIIDMKAIKAIAGKRISMENPSIMDGGIEAFTQFNRSTYWHQSTLSSRFNSDNFSKIDIAELAELLTELSPEVSGALWYYLLCCNSGYEYEVTRPGSETPYPEAKAYLDGCLKQLGSYHGTLNTFFDKIFMAIFMRGSFLMELILHDDAKTFADIAAPDTKTLHFKRKLDDVRGQIWDFGQYQNGSFVSLDIPTVRYVPLHPLPGKIEGRAMINPVFFTAIFLMSVLRDLKRVIQQQGYMRLDLSIDFEKLKEAMPDNASDDPKAFQEWADSITDDISRYYGQLEPDDAFVHGDPIKVNSPVGTANANSLTAMDALFKVLERMSVRALKSLSSLLGMDEGANQAAENRKFEFYQKGNETIQRMVESAFNDECKMILQAGGYQADPKLKFAQMRASEDLRDQQVATLKSKLARYQYDCGYISQDEAAKMATGKESADIPEPRSSGEGLNAGNIGQLQPDPGINRFGGFYNALDMIRTPTMNQLNEARKLWKEHSPDGYQNMIDAGIWEPE